MHFSAQARTYNTYGDHPTVSLVPPFLMRDAGDFGPAISRLVVIFHFPHSGPPRKTLEGAFDRFANYLKKLPEVTFRRKRGDAEIRIASTLIDGTDWRAMRDMSPAHFRGAVVETVDALSLLRKRLKPGDQFDLDAFLAHCERTKSAIPATSEELADFAAHVKRQGEHRQASMSPWELLDIDWSDWHPDARRILDDTFYWEVSDDFAPHGNDTGSDLVADYRRWFRKEPAANPIEFLERLLRRWGFAEDQGENAHVVRDEAAVALAFAELKLRAACTGEVLGRACEAMRRQRQVAIAAVDWPHREDRLRRLDMLEAKLAQQVT